MEKDPKQENTNSLGQLRDEISQLEEKLTEAKRQQLILSQERSPTESIYQWTAPERSFRPKSTTWYSIVGVVAVVSIVLAILTRDGLLVVAIIALLALFYALNTIPPKVFTYELLNKGLKVGEKIYTWKQIPRFWITQRGPDIFLNFEVIGEVETKLMILIGDGNLNIIAKELVQFIDYLEPNEVRRDLFDPIVQGRHKNLGEIVADDIQKQPIKKNNPYEETKQKIINSTS